jgi:hypothetical protein
MIDFRLVSPLVHLDFIHKKTLAQRLRGQSVKFCWLVKTVNKAAATGLANLPAAVPDSNAAEWCSAVDIGGKEGFKKI